MNIVLSLFQEKRNISSMEIMMGNTFANVGKQIVVRQILGTNICLTKHQSRIISFSFQLALSVSRVNVMQIFQLQKLMLVSSRQKIYSPSPKYFMDL